MERARFTVAAVVPVALAATIYGGVGGFEFVGMDDLGFVSVAPLVNQGLSLESALAAFSSFQSGFWIPLTWLSLMVDVSLFGPGAGPMHVVNASLHALNGVLVLAVLHRLTGFLWRSAAVAAVFVAHPLRVESVAWVIERKDVLSTLFMLLALAAYVQFARGKSRAWLAAATLGMAAGLMSKPMLLTFPALLLLVDYWPLGRWRDTALATPGQFAAPLRHLVLEKIPFLLLSAAGAAVLNVAQQASNSLYSLDIFSLAARCGKALASPVIFLQRFVWPVGLRFGPPFRPDELSWELPVISAVLLVAVTVWASSMRRRRPAIAVGWLWYLIALVPVGGLVPSGKQGFENRFTYVPHLGVVLAIVWWTADAARRSRRPQRTLVLLAILVVAGLAALSRQQVGLWRDGATLFGDAVTRFPDDLWSRQLFGMALQRDGSHERATEQFREVLVRRPGDVTALLSNGASLGALGRVEESLAYFEHALALDPANAQAHYNLAVAQGLLGKPEEAERHYRQALLASPGDVEARFNLALLLFERGRTREARREFAEVARLAPHMKAAQEYLARLSRTAGDGSP